MKSEALFLDGGLKMNIKKIIERFLPTEHNMFLMVSFLIFLNAMDWMTTMIALTHENIIEANPVVNHLLYSNPELLIYIKLLWVPCLLSFVILTYKQDIKNKKYYSALLLMMGINFMIAVYIFIVFNNILNMRVI